MHDFLKRGISFPAHFVLINIMCLFGSFFGVRIVPPVLSILISTMGTLVLEPIFAVMYIFMRFAGWPYYTTNMSSHEKNFLSPELQTEIFNAAVSSLSTCILSWIVAWHFIRGMCNPSGGANARLRHHKWMFFGEIGSIVIFLLYKQGAGALIIMAISLA